MARKNGLVINIASVVALAPERLNGTYSGTKAYVVNFTQALKNEVEGKGVTVQAVLPGATATPFWEKAGRPVERFAEGDRDDRREYGGCFARRPGPEELITIPALPDVADWEKYESRASSGPNLSRKYPRPVMALEIDSNLTACYSGCLLPFRLCSRSREALSEQSSYHVIRAAARNSL